MIKLYSRRQPKSTLYTYINIIKSLGLLCTVDMYYYIDFFIKFYHHSFGLRKNGGAKKATKGSEERGARHLLNGSKERLF